MIDRAGGAAARTGGQNACTPPGIIPQTRTKARYALLPRSVLYSAAKGESHSMLEDFLQRRPYNAVTDLLDAQVARGLGAKVAFVDSDRSLSYGELQARTCRFASALKNLGLHPEERLSLLLYDTVDFPVAFWGAVRAGVVVLPLN